MDLQPSSRRPPATLLALIVAVSLLGVGVPTAAASASIEGVWSFGGGEIAIQPGPGATFIGTVVAEANFAECVHPDGQQIWTDMTLQPDGSYWGLHQWYFEHSGCIENPERGPTAWRVFEEADGSRYLRVCLSSPGTSQPTIAADDSAADVTYGCYNSALTAPLPISGASGLIERLYPSAKKCLSRRRFAIHLAEPRDDPFKKLRISLRGRRIRTVRRGDYEVAIVNLKGLPLGAFTIRVSATTVLGVRLTGSRTYHTCAKKPKRHKPARLKAIRPGRRRSTAR